MFAYKSKRQFLIVYGVIFGGAVMGFLVRLSKFEEFTTKGNFLVSVVSIALITFIWESLRYINRFLNTSYPFEKNIAGRIVLQLFCGTIVGLIVRSIIYYFGEPNIPFKLDSLFLATTWALYALLPAFINLIFFTDYFIGRWKDSLVLAERLEKEKSQVQFDNLKNQLNPHFLFNALTSLNSLIFEDQKLASQFLQHLSKVYRYVLQNKDKNFVPLVTELNFIQGYVFLLETRFLHAVKISINVKEEKKEQAIVPVTLQILIENALKHNIADREKPLHIDITVMGDYLIVSNNLQERKMVETSNRMGLDNLKSLYRFLTDKPVLIEKTDNRFAVKVPLL